jgi:hypothetical protein
MPKPTAEWLMLTTYTHHMPCLLFAEGYSKYFLQKHERRASEKITKENSECQHTQK